MEKILARDACPHRDPIEINGMEYLVEHISHHLATGVMVLRGSGGLHPLLGTMVSAPSTTPATHPYKG
jgi:hypothetical protein